jgi:Ser/Thr protein kinase RdoA (MazF antagonist)
LQEGEGYEEFMSSWFLDGYQSINTLSEIELEFIPIFQNIRSVESAKKHFIRVIQGDQQVHAGLIMYWDRITSKLE